MPSPTPELTKARCSIVTHVVAREDLELRGGAAAGAAGGLRRSFRAGERIFMEQSRKFDEARRLASAPPTVTPSLTLTSSPISPNPAQSPAVP